METTGTHLKRSCAAWRLVIGIGMVALVASAADMGTRPVDAAPSSTTSSPLSTPHTGVRTVTIRYRAWNGAVRIAAVILPAWYRPGHNPPLPLVISPHGRGGTGRGNATYWGNLPGVGGFAVVNPDGMGRKIPSYSFALPRQIDDLAKMPSFVTKALPWVRIDRNRIYALGSSMGGLETLMLVARHPHLLAGAAAMDSVADMVLRYKQMPHMPCNARCLKVYGRPYGLVLRDKLVTEVGGTPAAKHRAWVARSPRAHAAAIARSGVPLQIWWSRKDRIVTNQATQSGALYRTLRHLNPKAPVSEYIGRWRHSHEMRSTQLLPVAVAGFGLIHTKPAALPRSVSYLAAPVA